LLQQEEALVLLRGKPLQRALDEYQGERRVCLHVEHRGQ
jgi:hypothetical protein